LSGLTSGSVRTLALVPFANTTSTAVKLTAVGLPGELVTLRRNQKGLEALNRAFNISSTAGGLAKKEAPEPSSMKTVILSSSPV